MSGSVVVNIGLEIASALGDSEIKYGRLMVACLPELNSSNNCQSIKSKSHLEFSDQLQRMRISHKGFSSGRPNSSSSLLWSSKAFSNITFLIL